jgi:hypothetical protein
MAKVKRSWWNLFFVLLIVTGVGILATNPSQARVPKINLTPTAFTLAEGESSQISAMLDEPIICPPDPNLSCSVILDFTASVPAGISLSNSSIEWAQADFSQAKTLTVSMTNPSLFANNQVFSLVAVANSRSEYYSGFSVEIAVTVAVAQITTTTTNTTTTTTTTAATTTVAATTTAATTTIAPTTTQPPTPSTTVPSTIGLTPSVSNLPATGNALNLASIAISTLIIGLVAVVTRRRPHNSRPQ